MNTKPFQSLPLLALISLLSACGGGDNGPGTGTMNAILTDAPACGFEHVYVTVEKVRAHVSSTANPDADGWHEVTLPTPQKIDLLELSNGVFETLGHRALPAVHYEQIRLVLSPNTGSDPLRNSIVPDGGTEEPLDTPSATQSGYKVVGEFTVPRDSQVDLVLDFDACSSIVQKGNGSYALKPVVTATPMMVSGSISGYVDPADAGARVLAEQNGRIVKGTVADSSGRFVLSPVLRSDGNGLYDIVITRPGDTTVVVRGVPVAAGTSTTVSTQAVPFQLPASTVHSASGTVSPASAEAVLRAIQTSNGGNYVVDLANANLDTGAWSLSLPSAAPLLGDYTGSLPVTLAPDASAAGQYTIRATTALGASQSAAVDLSSGDASNVNFLF